MLPRDRKLFPAMTHTSDPYINLVDSLVGLYPDWDGTKQFQDTPRRLREMYEGFCWGQDRINDALDEHTRLFEDSLKEEMSISGIRVVSLCPHHLLPCEFTVSISYEPDGHVLGLSKFARIAVILGKRPIMQEAYTRELADCLFQRIKPKSVEVEVFGVHGCMMYRGALQAEAEVTTKVRLP